MCFGFQGARVMSMFGDYKAYKKYEPAYQSWKSERDILNAKRVEYLKKNPEKINKDDIKRGETLIRAIDIMDEYSQNYAENMEVATEAVSGLALEGALFGGIALGGLVSVMKPVRNYLKKISGGGKSQWVFQIIPMAAGALIGTIASFPINAWAAKAEVSASRKGRFEAMRKELQNPNGFAVLTEAQIKEAQENAKSIKLPEDKKNSIKGLKKSINTVKNMAVDSNEYKKQRKMFEYELEESERHLNDSMSEQEILEAQKDKQLLTKLVEKIDIASQDYAENTELACTAVNYGLLGAGALFTMGLNKLLNAMKVKSAGKITKISAIASFTAPVILSMMYAKVQKQASRVGRFMMKQELMKNPEQLVYVSDEDASKIADVSVNKDKKQNIFKFLVDAWKNNKKYEKYQKTQGKVEKKFYKAVETLELSPEQIKRAKQLQTNTFRTFNKVDENSQKYSESVEALGKSLSYPLIMGLTTLGSIVMGMIMMKKPKKPVDDTIRVIQAVAANILCLSPMVLVEAKITKEQKRASRIADMQAIKELDDYRLFK